MRLAGKTCVVTAAGQGIGAASALAFANEGATVIATDINQDALNQLATQHLNISTALLDVTNKAQIEAFVAATGAIDVLFNCAGWVPAGSILECSESDWQRAFDINVTSMYRLIQGFLPGMLTKGKASIINMSSAASSIKGVPNRFVYSASKAAVLGLTKAIAADYITQGVRCNAICPGWVLTPLVQKQVDAKAAQHGISNEEATKLLLGEKEPSMQFTTPEELGALAVFFCSPAANNVRGVAWNMDGGWTAQ